jgi:hypothetical protein
LHASLSAALIDNIVTNSITHQATTLQVALVLILIEKRKVLSKLRGIMYSASGLVQDVAAKFDGNISSVNGLRSTHALALLITQVQSMVHLDIFLSDERPSIKRVKKEDRKNILNQQLPFIAIMDLKSLWCLYSI